MTPFALLIVLVGIGKDATVTTGHAAPVWNGICVSCSLLSGNSFCVEFVESDRAGFGIAQLAFLKLLLSQLLVCAQKPCSL